MKIHTILVTAALALLTQCSSPGSAAQDPFRVALGHSALEQMAAHGQVSAAMAGASPARAPLRYQPRATAVLPPLAPLRPLTR